MEIQHEKMTQKGMERVYLKSINRALSCTHPPSRQPLFANAHLWYSTSANALTLNYLLDMFRLSKRLLSSGNQLDKLLDAISATLGITLKPGLVDPRVTGYLGENQTFETIYNRGLLLRQVADVIESRRLEFQFRNMDLNGPGTKNENFTMATAGASGTGKTRSIGLLMDLSLALKDNRRPIAIHYIKDNIGEQRGDVFVNNFENTVVVPITFNCRVPYSPSEGSPAMSVYSRFLKSILSGDRDRVFLENVRAAIQESNVVIHPGLIYDVLDRAFAGPKTNFLFCVDEFLSLQNATTQLDVLNFMNRLMDIRSSSFVFITSLDIATIQRGATASRRQVKVVELNSVQYPSYKYHFCVQTLLCHTINTHLINYSSRSQSPHLERDTHS